MDSKKLNFNQAISMCCKYTPYKDLLSLYANKKILNNVRTNKKSIYSKVDTYRINRY